MQMNIHELHVRIVKLSGRLDAYTVGTMRDMQATFAHEPEQRYVIDLSAVTFLDSAWISVLVSLLKTARKSGGNVVLVPPRDANARNIFEITRFDQVFTMAPSVAKALVSL